MTTISTSCVRVRIIATLGSAKGRTKADKELVEELDTITRTARDVLDAVAIPIKSEDNWRCVPVELYPEFLQAWSPVITSFKALVPRLGAPLSQEVSLSQVTEDYPEGNFSAIRHVPLQSGLAQLHRVRMSNMEASIPSGVLQAIRAPVAYFAERMLAYDARPPSVPKRLRAEGQGRAPRTGVFRDSVLTNVHDVVRRARAWNVARNPDIDEITARLGGFERLTGELLRNNDEVRKAARERAEEIARHIDTLTSK